MFVQSNRIKMDMLVEYILHITPSPDGLCAIMMIERHEKVELLRIVDEAELTPHCI